MIKRKSVGKILKSLIGDLGFAYHARSWNNGTIVISPYIDTDKSFEALSKRLDEIGFDTRMTMPKPPSSRVLILTKRT